MRSRTAEMLVLFLVGAAACGGSSATTADAGGGGPDAGGDGAGPGGDAGSEASASNLYTLDTCTTDIAADVPAFYRTYFKCVTIKKTADGVSITWNGAPPHASYYWGQSDPNYAPFDTTRGPTYRPNPNTIAKRTRTMTVLDAPVSRGLTVTTPMVDRTANTNANEYRLGPVGVALDSVMIFNDQARPGDDIAEERFTFDEWNAHPTMNGEYHYHTTSPGPLAVLKAIGKSDVELYGIMCDGAVVLGCMELDGSTVDASGLDAQNGHVGDVKDKAGTTHFTNRYHVHMCPAVLTAHVYTPEIQYYAACTVQ